MKRLVSKRFTQKHGWDALLMASQEKTPSRGEKERVAIDKMIINLGVKKLPFFLTGEQEGRTRGTKQKHRWSPKPGRRREGHGGDSYGL